MKPLGTGEGKLEQVETLSSHLSQCGLCPLQRRMRNSEEAGRFIRSQRLALVRVDSVFPAASASLVVFSEAEEGQRVRACVLSTMRGYLFCDTW